MWHHYRVCRSRLSKFSCHCNSPDPEVINLNLSCAFYASLWLIYRGMKGQLSEQPLAELIREISLKFISGRVRLEHERIHVVAYFDRGRFLYAASNVQTLRVREYLKKFEAVSDQDLAQFNERVSDTDLLRVLCAQKLLSPAVAEQVQTQLVADVLRLALLWTEGTWEFEPRSRLGEQLNPRIDMGALLLDAGRRLPGKFAASRFGNPAEIITPVDKPLVNENLLPAEVFLLSRVDRPTTVRELVAVSGLGEEETLGHMYSLALGDLLKRERWHSVFRGEQPARLPEPEKIGPAVPASPVEREPTPETDHQDLESFLVRVKGARTHYEVLGVQREISAPDLKAVYYQLARRYHPDRFRKSDALLVPQIESAFARITQAYDTLRDDQIRAGYDAKLEARKKADQLADAAPKANAPVAPPQPAVEGVAEPVVSAAERAETQFKEGFAALELGQRKVALALLAAAASAVPNEPRYRAFYGKALAGNEATKRAAEAELSAAIKLEPKNAEYRVMLAELYRDLGLKLRAKGEAERAVAADPNNRKARELLRALT
jgi:curved DNA-binding protein CbpA